MRSIPSKAHVNQSRATNVVDITTHPVFALATPLPVADAEKPPYKMPNQLLDELLELPPSNLFAHRKLCLDLENSLDPESAETVDETHIQVHARKAYEDFMIRESPKVDRNLYEPVGESNHWNSEWTAEESRIESGGSSLEVRKYYSDSSFDSSSGVELDGEDEDMDIDREEIESGILEIIENMDSADAKGKNNVPAIKSRMHFNPWLFNSSLRLEQSHQEFCSASGPPTELFNS